MIDYVYWWLIVSVLVVSGARMASGAWRGYVRWSERRRSRSCP